MALDGSGFPHYGEKSKVDVDVKTYKVCPPIIKRGNPYKWRSEWESPFFFCGCAIATSDYKRLIQNAKYPWTF